MSEPARTPLGLAIAHTAERNVERFRRANAAVLLALAFAVIAAVFSQDWLPRWPVYFLVTLLVLAALLHSWINKAFEGEQLKRWHDLLTLAATVTKSAGAAASNPSQQHSPALKPVPKARPPLRVFRPDEEPSKNGLS